MRKKYLILVSLMTLLFWVAACGNDNSNDESVGETPEDEVVNGQTVANELSIDDLRGTTVTFYGWGGGQNINDWLDHVVAPSLYENYEITLQRVGMDIGDILNLLIGEKEAGVEEGNIDVVWINGENFHVAIQADLLYGPISERVPNVALYLDPDLHENNYDFGTPINGMSVPYGRAQLVFVGDTAEFDSFPSNATELMEFAQANPGRFTYIAPPQFTGSAFVRNLIYEIVGFETLNNASEDEIYDVIRPALDFMIDLKPYLWQEGTTYPTTADQLSEMFVDGIAPFAISYTPLYAAQMILSGEFPNTAQTFLFDNGNIGNTHYMAVPFNAPNTEGALVVINHIISPEIQITKYDANNWGDLPVFDVNRISDEQREALEAIDNGVGILTATELQERRVPEVAGWKVPIIDQLWIEYVLGHNQ